MKFKAVGEVQETLENMIYRRDGDMLHLQDRLESLSVDFNLPGVLMKIVLFLRNSTVF